MLKCLKNLTRDEESSSAGSVPVYLNVYDLTPFNGYSHWLGLGAYHSGVQVHGVEYAYGAHEHATTGIFEGEPKQCEGFRFRKAILIGKTAMAAGEVRKVMEDLAEHYRGNAYNLISKNCNHFCNDACIRLTRTPIPTWVNRLARIGFLFNCVLPANLNSTKIGIQKMGEKNEEIEKKSGSNTVTPLSNTVTPLSSSSPQVRGRSRIRRRRRCRRTVDSSP